MSLLREKYSLTILCFLLFVVLAVWGDVFVWLRSLYAAHNLDFISFLFFIDLKRSVASRGSKTQI